MTDETPRADARTPELSVSKTTRDGAVALWVALDEAGIEARLQPFNGRWRVFYPASAHRRVSECSQQVRAARTPEPAGDSEPTDVRELRERLEKLEALRSRLQMFLAAVGASTPDDHPWVVEARALANALRPCELATPAPAPQQGGTDD